MTGRLVAGDSSAYVPDEAVTLRASRNPISERTSTPIATSGAVNRPGKKTPAVNPITVTTVTPTAPTNAGHSGGPPQVACSAVWIYSTATAATNASSSQHNVPASATLSRAHAARGAAATRSTVFLRPSRDPARAASPPANALNAYSMWLPITDSRRVQTGGNPSAVRSASKLEHRREQRQQVRHRVPLELKPQ